MFNVTSSQHLKTIQSLTLNLSRSICNHHQPRYVSLVDFFDHLLQYITTLHHHKQIHAQIITTGSYRSAFLSSKLVTAYSRLNLVFDSRKVFEATPFECLSNLLLWNSIVRANVTNGFCNYALKLYDKMRKVGVFGDGFTFPMLVRACGFMGSDYLCRNIHNHVLKMGFRNHLHVVNELMGIYAKIDRMDYACFLFDRMAVRSYISWNTIMSGFAMNYDCEGAFKMFRRMEVEGLEPNSVTWTSLLSSYYRCGKTNKVMDLFGVMRTKDVAITGEALAVVLSSCADSETLKSGMRIHGYAVKCGFNEYLFVKNALINMYGKHTDVAGAHNLFSEIKSKSIVSWNALITAYAESGLCDEALALFSQMEKSTVRPNIISWSAVINSFASQNRGEESLNLFRQMQHINVLANSVTLVSVLSVCAELAALNLGKEIHCHAIRGEMEKNILIGNGLVNMYTKCGYLKEGHLVFEKIIEKDSVSWNSMISGYGMHGICENALATFDQMVKTGFKPDGVTFVAILSACSHGGFVSRGRQIFDMMIKEFNIEPKVEHYACMVDLYGRAGLLKEASDIVKNMPIEPNICVWGALLNSCRTYKNTVIAEEIASQIFSLTSGTTGSYMLLSNIYAANGRWEDSARVRVSAQTKGLKKIPGQSWIELKKKFHMFSAGNNNNKMCVEDIYRILEDLSLPMESEGYVPNVSCLQEEYENKLIQCI
ncbi:hypothetical protein ACFE04_003802 [Oxalis oulophora]